MIKRRVFAVLAAAVLLIPAEPKMETGEKLLLLAEELSLTPTLLYAVSDFDAGKKPEEYAREVFLSLVSGARGVSGSITNKNGRLEVLLSSIPTNEAEKNMRNVLRTFLENESSVKHILKAEASEDCSEMIQKRLGNRMISCESTQNGTTIRLEGVSIDIRGGIAYLRSP